MPRSRSRSRRRNRSKSRSRSLFSAKSRSKLSSRSRKSIKNTGVIYRCKRPMPGMRGIFSARIFPGSSAVPLALTADLARIPKTTCAREISFPSGSHAVQSLRNVKLRADSTHFIMVSYINDVISGFSVILTNKFRTNLMEKDNTPVCKKNEVFIDSLCVTAGTSASMNVKLMIRCLRRFSKSINVKRIVTHSPRSKSFMFQLGFRMCSNPCSNCDEKLVLLPRATTRGPKFSTCVY